MATRRFSSPKLSANLQHLHATKNSELRTQNSLALTQPLNRSTAQLIFLFILILSSLLLVLSTNTVYAAQVTLAWDRNAEQNVEGYKVYYGTASRDYDWFIDVGDVTTITLTDLADGFTYYFAATAYDNANPPHESDYSSEVSKNTCTYAISPTSASFGASGGNGSVSVTTQKGCPWTASSGVSWMTITSGSSGTGNGTFNYSIASNTGGSRTSSSTIAGRVFTVTQSGATTYTITASAGTGGSISPSGSVSVAQGGSQSFTISANTGYQISNVTVDGVSQGAISSYTFSNVTANHTISTTFTANSYTITVSAGTGGTISPNGSVNVNHGASQSFTITPNTGYGVANVLVDGASVGAVTSYTFNDVIANHTISASFAVNTFTINASAGAGGSISPSGAVPVSGGLNQAFAITPNTGYRIADVLVDGSSVGSVTSYTFTNVNSSHTISASFAANTYTIITSAGVGGSISPSGSVTVNHGANQTFTINPNTGYAILNVVVDGSSVGSVSSYTFSNVTANHTISATFSLGTHTINASASAGGTISPSGSVTVAQGANQTFTITPDSGSAIADVLVDGSSAGAVNSYTFINVSSSHTISASFITVLSDYRLNTGGGQYTDGLGNVYGADQYFSGGQTYTLSSPIDGTTDDALYQSERFGNFSYAIPLANGDYAVVLKFAEIYWSQAGKRVFNVLVEGQLAIANLDIFAQAGGKNWAYDVSLPVSVTDGVLNISFQSIVDNAKVSAIEVRPLEGYVLRVTTTGTGTGDVTTNPSGTIFPPGTKVTLRATKDVSSAFAGFSGDCTNNRTSCTVIMNKHAAVTAEFKLKTLKVNTVAVGNGTVSIEEPVSIEGGIKTKSTKKVNRSKIETNVDYGDQLVYSITPEPGSYIKKVWVDGKSQGSIESLTLIEVKHNHKVKVKFGSETKKGSYENVNLTRNQIFLRDDDEQDELQTLNDLPADDDDNPIEHVSTQFASIKR